MNNTWTVFKFELKNQLKKKSFWISNIIMVLIILAVTSLPTIIGFFMDEPITGEETGNSQVQGESAPDFAPDEFGKYYIDTNIDREIFENTFPFTYMEEAESLDSLENQIMNDEVETGVVIEDNNFRVLVKSESITTDKSIYGQGYADYINKVNLIGQGLDPGLYDQLIMDAPYPQVESLEKSSSQNFILAYVGVFVIYFMIILYGSSTATMIATEKSNRTMEILITSTRATPLVLGKVFAGMAAALLQIIILFLTIIIGIFINKDSYPIEILNYIKDSITPGLFIVFLLFALIGFTLYLFIYATSGALVSKIEDLNKAITPIQTIAIIAFFVGFFGLYGSRDSTLLVVSSYIPFTAPYSMFIRYAAFGVSTGELLLSLAILIITTIIIAIICIRIYRSATLNYGNNVNIFSEIKKLATRDKE